MDLAGFGPAPISMAQIGGDGAPGNMVRQN